MKTTLATVGLLAATLSGCAFAQGSGDPNAVRAGSYKIDPDHTQVNWAVSHLGYSIYEGRFDTVSGTLSLDPKNAANDRLDITIQTASIDTPSAKLNGQLVGESWFDAKRFPTIVFRSTGVVATGKDTASVTGDLTLHGVTRPVTLETTFVGAGLNLVFGAYFAGFQASGTIKRSDFGVSAFTPLIGDETRLTLNGAFIKQ